MSDGVDTPSRRAVLAIGGAAMLAAALTPHKALADISATEVELRRLFGDKPMNPSKVRLELPLIAENGLVVPVRVEVESPMTEADHVKAVHLFADGNPSPPVASFYFTPANGTAIASSRIRLATSQTVIAVAEMSNGALHVTRAPIKVTIGGCGG
jgi:sulfur-oxidizing protein SoxY